MKKWFLKSPSTTDLISLLQAWRIWVVGALLGALVAAAVFYLSPPSYRATTTVLVDQNAEQAVPEERSDLVIYTYLQRETDKLVEIAWSDQVMDLVVQTTGFKVSDLRHDLLQLSQPSDGGWHFMADNPDPDTAAALASAWAGAFVEVVQSHPAGLNDLLEINHTLAEDLPVQRTVSLGVFVFSGAVLVIVCIFLVLLVADKKK